MWRPGAMIPIAALLNTDYDERKDGEFEMKSEPVAFHRQTSSTGSTSSDELEDVIKHSTEEDDDDMYSNQLQHPSGSPTTAEASSLLGALTLQKLRYAETSTSVASTDAKPQVSRAYLSIENLTNPVEEDDQVRDSSKPPTPGQEARAARRRSTRALFPGATDDDRRAKQRMIVKRCYYKKINTINELREQVQELETVLNTVLEDKESERSDEDTQASGSNLDEYVEVVKDKEVLRHENQRLRKLADEYYMKNQGRLRLLLDANRKEMVLFTPAISDE